MTVLSTRWRFNNNTKKGIQLQSQYCQPPRWVYPISCPAVSCRSISCRPFRARPFRACPISCPSHFVPDCPIPCLTHFVPIPNRALLMTNKSKGTHFMPVPFRAKAISCLSHFVPRPVHSPLSHFMPVPFRAHPKSYPLFQIRAGSI